jgi:3-hydroxybutyryl-CoA dehydrogenase
VLQIYLLSTTYFCKKQFMLIAVLATEEQWKELLDDGNRDFFIRVTTLQDEVTADAYLVLDEQLISAVAEKEKPVLVNAVVKTLTELNAAKNVLRINGWNGFIQRKTWEIAGHVTDEIKQIFAAAGKQLIVVADEPGLVAARSISMIINEAYFAWGEEVSTKAEIDTAMKLGTNYPYGPFEWAEKIGLKNIYQLLASLRTASKRYSPAPLLQKEATA